MASTAYGADLTSPMSTPAAPAPVRAQQIKLDGLLCRASSPGYHTGNISIHGCTGFCPLDPKLDGGLAGIQFRGTTGRFFERHRRRRLRLDPGKPYPDSHLDAQIYQYDLKQRFTAIAGARVGRAFDRWLPYAFGGVEFTNLEITDSAGNSFDNDYVGLAAGVGVEYAITRHLSFDGRYMYTHLPGENFDFGGGPGEIQRERLFVPGSGQLPVLEGFQEKWIRFSVRKRVKTIR